jgi:heme/copper-type cytochrome/quinol oxidase subunit 1
MLVTSFLIIMAMPAIMIASTALILDRLVGTHFFNPAEGGDVLLWQHLFWFFGHPEVYIIFLPAVGMVSTIVATFTRRPVFGYLGMVMALIATGILAFGLWVHHMFVAGLPRLGESFFTASSMAIAVPAGLQIFCWLATIWAGRPVFKTPFLFVIGFMVIFVIGGMTGVMVASVPFDTQVHDTYFVVAHFHYVLVGGAVFPLLGAIYYWFPKITGRMMSETIGRWAFGLIFTGFKPDLLSYAYSRATGHAAPHLHLSAGDALVGPQHVRQPERYYPRCRFPAVLHRRHPQCCLRARSVG